MQSLRVKITITADDTRVLGEYSMPWTERELPEVKRWHAQRHGEYTATFDVDPVEPAITALAAQLYARGLCDDDRLVEFLQRMDSYAGAAQQAIDHYRNPPMELERIEDLPACDPVLAADPENGRELMLEREANAAA